MRQTAGIYGSLDAHATRKTRDRKTNNHIDDSDMINDAQIDVNIM